MKYKVGDIVLVGSPAGEAITKIHVRLLERIEVKPQKGKRVGIRTTMDWPGYKGWMATPVYEEEIKKIRKEWNIPFTKPGEDKTFVYDEYIICAERKSSRLERKSSGVVRRKKKQSVEPRLEKRKRNRNSNRKSTVRKTHLSSSKS